MTQRRDFLKKAGAAGAATESGARLRGGLVSFFTFEAAHFALLFLRVDEAGTGSGFLDQAGSGWFRLFKRC